jgi:lysozyme family protein
MAVFTPAFNLSKVNEGGYVNDPRDLGGETYRGVARKFHPNWSGWAVIDAMKKTKPIPKFYTDATLDKHAEAFYRKEYWNNMLGDLINDQQNAQQI